MSDYTTTRTAPCGLVVMACGVVIFIWITLQNARLVGEQVVLAPHTPLSDVGQSRQSDVERRNSLLEAGDIEGWLKAVKGKATAEYEDNSNTTAAAECSVTLRLGPETATARSPALCSRSLFSSYLSTHAHLLGSGHWSGTEDHPHFKPDVCTLLSNFSFAGYCSLCGESGRSLPKKIVLVGDSNGARVMLGMMRRLRDMGGLCSFLRKERIKKSETDKLNVRDPNYFTVKDLPLEYLQGEVLRHRGAAVSSFRVNCRFGKSHDIHLEYILSLDLIDSSLYMSGYTPGKMRKGLFSTLLQYLFKHYFRATGYPEVFLLYAQFKHVKWHSPLPVVAQSIRYINMLIKTYLPSTTTVFWIPSGRECVAKTPLYVPRDVADGMDINLILQALNDVLSDALYKEAVAARTLVEPSHASIHGFLDLGRITCPITCLWHVDGAHMTKAWYDAVARYLLQMFCT